MPTDREFVFSRGAAQVGDYTDTKAKLDRAAGTLPAKIVVVKTASVAEQNKFLDLQLAAV